MIIKPKIFFVLTLVVLLFAAVFALYKNNAYSTGSIFVLSISSDGNYVVSTDDNRQAILWNLKNQTWKILDNKANVYSAYFIKNSNNYMWQHDVNNEVIIKNIEGKTIKKFNPRFPTYGQIITNDLKKYFATNDEWDVYFWNGKIIKKINDGYLSFLGEGKIINWSLSKNEDYALSSGSSGYKFSQIKINQPKGRINLNGVVLWSTKTGQPIRKFPGNQVYTYATISPDGKYIVSGDSNGLGFVWALDYGDKIASLTSPLGRVIKTLKDNYGWDNKGYPKLPSGFKNDIDKLADALYSVKFIDKNHYLRFTTCVPYAILHEVTDPKPLKYLKLGKDPMPSICDYVRDQSIDTSPKAHILVTGQQNGNGIIVYQYDPKTKTLKKTWSPTISWWSSIF